MILRLLIPRDRQRAVLARPPGVADPSAAQASALALPEVRPPAAGRLRGGALLALAALCMILFGLRLNAPFLYDDGEARYAAVAREMAQTETWWQPRFQGDAVRKPPLVFWMMAGARAVLGDGEAAARLPSAVAGTVAVLGTAALGARLFGAQAGLLAGLLLATMFQFAWVARKGQLDMPLTACLVLAHGCLFRALQGGRRRWWAAGYACVAMGTMAKGLVGAVLPLGTLGVYALTGRRGGELLRPRSWGPATIAGAAVGLYYAALGPEFVEGFLREDHLRRFVAGVDVVEPIWWYVPLLLLSVLPYAGWLPFAVGAVGRGEGVRPVRPAGFAAWWFLVWFVTINLSRGKQEQYVVPLLPPLAMLMAAGLVRATARPSSRWARAGIAAAPATVALGSVLFLGYLLRRGHFGAWPAAAFGLLALAGLSSAWGAFRWPLRRALRAAVGCGILTAIAVITAALPPLERARAAPIIVAAQALRRAAGEDPIVSYGPPYTPTPRVTFYLRPTRPLRRLRSPEALDAFLRSDRTSFLLLQRADWEALEGRRLIARPVAAQVRAGAMDYVLLGPPPAGPS